jgi:hypothetical protein
MDPAVLAQAGQVLAQAGQGDPAAQAQVPAAIQVLAPVAAAGNPAAIQAIEPVAAAGDPAAIQALAPVAAGNVDGAIGGDRAQINAIVPAVSALAAAAGAGNQAAIAAIVPANNAAAAAAGAVIAATAPRLGLLSALASGSAATASAIGNAVSGALSNVTGRVLSARPSVPALAPLPQSQGPQANAPQGLPAIQQAGQAGVPAVQLGAVVAGQPIPNVQALPQAAPPVAPPAGAVRANQGQYRMRGNPIRGPSIQDREHIVGQLANNIIMTPEIIAESIIGEMNFLSAYNIIPGYPGYDVILTELVLLRLQLILGGVFLTINSSHFLDRAQVAAEIEANDYRRRLSILESQAHALIASAGVYANQLRLDMIIKFRRETLTEELIANELNSAYERIKFGQHGQIINDYGPFIVGMRAAINTMTTSGQAERAAGDIPAARLIEIPAGERFLFETYPNLLRMLPVTIHNQVIKIKLRQIEAAASLYAYYLATDPEQDQRGPHAGRPHINMDYLDRVVRVFMTSDNRLTQLGINRFRVDLAPALGLNPYAYLFDRTVIDMGRFLFRFGNNTRLGTLALLSQLVHSHPTSQALNPQFIHQMMVAIEEQLGASNSAPGTLVLADPLVRNAQGEITGVSLGGAGFEAPISLTDDDITRYISTIVGNMVNNTATPDDKITLQTYFRSLIDACIAGNPANLPCIPGGPDATIANPYYDIEDSYQTAVREAHNHAMTTGWAELVIARLRGPDPGNNISFTYARYAVQAAIVEKRASATARASEKGAANRANALKELSGVSIKNFKYTAKTRSNQSMKRANNNRKKIIRSLRNINKAPAHMAINKAPAPMAVFGGSRKRRVKRTRKNRKRTRRQ